MHRLSVCALLLTTTLFAGCSGPARTPSRPASARARTAPAVQDALARRPLPHPMRPSPAFLRAVERGTRTLDGRPGPAYWQQEARYTLKARLDPDARRLDGSVSIAYTNRSPDALSVLYLEMVQNLHAPGARRNVPAEVTGGITLHRVAVEGRDLPAAGKTPPRYAVNGTLLAIEPAAPVAPGATISLAIDWSFTLPQAGVEARMGYSGDDLFFVAYWYPRMAVYDDVDGWFTDPFLGRAEMYHGFADYDLTVDVPEGWLVAATGTLQHPDSVLAPAVAERLRRAQASDRPAAVVGPGDRGRVTAASPSGRLRWHFRASNVRDVTFSATKNGRWDAARTPIGDRDGDGRIDYATVHAFYRASAPRWQDVVRYQQHALAFHAAYTGLPYPWPHMTAVEGGGIIEGGMEYPMMTLIGDYNARGDSALYWVTAHELAHMWIPMVVGTNERRFSWMDEGATTFLENRARADFFPGRDHDAPDRADYLTAARAGREGPMLRWADHHYTDDAFSIASYSKPATVLVALRGLLGAETFRTAYRAFLRDWAYKHPAPVDFFNTFERESGRDLDWFWHSWYAETWTLDQAVADVIQYDDYAEIVLHDLGRVPMPVTLTVALADGTLTSAGLAVEAWLQGRTKATVKVYTPAPVTRVEIDAARLFPDVNRGNNVWVKE